MTSAASSDAGLQPERTSLAWRRTALAVAIGSIVSLRVLTAALEHPVWFVPGVLGVCFAGWMWWASERRRVAFTARLAAPSSGGVSAPGAGALLVLLVFVVAVGTLAITAVVSAVA